MTLLCNCGTRAQLCKGTERRVHAVVAKMFSAATAFHLQQLGFCTNGVSFGCFFVLF